MTIYTCQPMPRHGSIYTSIGSRSTFLLGLQCTFLLRSRCTFLLKSRPTFLLGSRSTFLLKSRSTFLLKSRPTFLLGSRSTFLLKSRPTFLCISSGRMLVALTMMSQMEMFLMAATSSSLKIPFPRFSNQKRSPSRMRSNWSMMMFLSDRKIGYNQRICSLIEWCTFRDNYTPLLM